MIEIGVGIPAEVQSRPRKSAEDHNHLEIDQLLQLHQLDLSIWVSVSKILDALTSLKIARRTTSSILHSLKVYIKKFCHF